MTLRRKKLIICFASALLAVALFVMFAGTAWAQAVPAAPAPAVPKSGGASGIISKIAEPIALIYAVIFFAQSLASGIMSFSGVILDKLFVLNTAIAPNTISVVLDGWTLMRDIANSLFILIILWIAFTIIFNIENLGGKKLLVRVILIALLINFSLVMVSAVFGFANLLASPFQEAIIGKDGKTGLSEIIMRETKVYNAVEALQKEDLDKLKQEENNTSLAAKAGNLIAEGTTAKSVLVGCGLGSFLLAPTIVGSVALAGSCALWAPVISSWASSFLADGSLISGPIKAAVSMALGTFFLLLTAFAFLTAALVLLWRLVAMVLIAILAPGAFLLHALPGNYGQKYWNMWLESLFKWAFFAPAFYFLVYIALLVLNRMSAGRDQFNIFTGDLNKIFTLVVFLAFLFAAIGVARKMGITVADSFIKWGQKAGWAALGFAGGTAMRASMPTIGRWGKKLDARLSKSPALGRIAGITGVGTGLRQLTGLGRKQALDRQKKYAGMTSEEIQRALGQRAYITGTDRDAMLLELAKRRAVAPKEGIAGYGEDQMRTTVDRLRGVGGDYMNILKANPSIARAGDFESKDIDDAKTEALKFGLALDDNQAAQWHVWNKMSGEDMKNLDTKVFDSTASSSITKPDGTPLSRGDLAKEMFIGTARGEQFSGLGRASTSATEKVNNYLNTDRGKEMIKGMSPGAYQYLDLNLARGVGWGLPEQHDKPLAVLQGEFDKSKVRLKEYQERIAGLVAAGNAGKAAKVRDKASEFAAGKFNLRAELIRRGDATGRATDTQYEDLMRRAGGTTP